MAIFLDHNATTPVRPEARAAVLAAMEAGGNPSSIHTSGRKARNRMETARAIIARALCARAQDLVFTSGGTEANNLAIEGAIAAGGVKRLIVSAIEHAAVAECACATGLPVEIMPATAAGTADIGWLEARLARWDAEADGTPLVCLQAANNETGVLQPYAEAAALVRAAGGLMLVDAVQALGKTPFDFAASGAHYAAISAHKVGGPQGVGALILACDAPFAVARKGGGQEKGRRSGTENVPGVCGFAAAVEAALRNMAHLDAIAALRDRAASALKSIAPDICIIGEGSLRTPNTLAVATPDWSGEMQVIALDLAGVEVSAGSACSSGKAAASRAISAIAGEDLARCTIRVSLGWTTTPEDIDRFIAAWAVARERALPRCKQTA